jgi:acetyltransferase-like isoleucine patch superfamily enzyme
MEPGQYVVRFEPCVKKMGTESFTGIIDSYFYAEVEIGNYSTVASPCYFHGATEHPCVFNKSFVSTFPFGDKWNVDYPKAASKGKIEIGSDVWIGESVTILSGVKIGDGSIIGARSVIAKDVPPYAVVVGNPGFVKRLRFPPDIIAKLLKIRWWNWPKERIEENIELMKDIDKFVEKFS